MSNRRKSVISSKSRTSQHPESTIANDKMGKSSFDYNENQSGPLQDILANTRRSYNAQDEFVYLLYNEIAKNHLTNPSKTVSKTSDTNESDETGVGKKDKDLSLVSSDWKLSQPDEYAEVDLPNKNTYAGHLSRKQMEGDGKYRWGSGETYEGKFEANTIEGRGRIEWKDGSCYEGEFHKNYRHGIGNLISHDNRRFYIGEWCMGRKNGNGYCRYGVKDVDFYEGEWNTDKKHGTGYRTYGNGTRYLGKWKNDRRHGNGTMIWPNGDLYRGEWKNGKMNGYGEYVWNGFLNKSLSWPKENSYMGEWLDGKRHGRGVLKLNTVGGAKYSGNWYEDKKHGYGMIIGNSGAVTEGDPLFLDNILTPLDTDVETDLTEGEKEFRKSESLANSASKTSVKHKEPRKVEVFQPLQYPPLSYHVKRLLKAPEYPKRFSNAATIRSGKCRVCKSESECSCLRDFSENLEGKSAESSSPIKLLSSPRSSREFSNHPNNSGEEEISGDDKYVLRDDEEYEEHWVHNCLTTHMLELRKIYKSYAELYCAKGETSPAVRLSMGKIALWQLLRDCDIQRRGISLVQFQRYFALNESAFIEAELYPFERIEFFQFINALLEVSWHLYAKLGDVETEAMRGRLAGGLHRLLIKDIFPNAGKHVGIDPASEVSKSFKNLLPIYSVYQLYRDVGEPHTARQFLRATCVLKGFSDPKPLPEVRSETKATPSRLINGINAITIGERLSYVPGDEKSSESSSSELAPKSEDDFARDLLALRYLGASKMVSIMGVICPGIKDEDSDAIINMDYELTFLEFYEILLEATRVFINTKKVSKQDEASRTSAESLSSSQSVKSTVELQRSSLKSSKVKKNISLMNNKGVK